jgi:hypothetical protein
MKVVKLSSMKWGTFITHEEDKFTQILVENPEER